MLGPTISSDDFRKTFSLWLQDVRHKNRKNRMAIKVTFKLYIFITILLLYVLAYWTETILVVWR